MYRFFALLILGLGACAPTAPPAEPKLVAFNDFWCPKSVDIAGYVVKAHLGPDYTICELEPTKEGLLAAELRVGGHWALPGRSEFAGFTSTDIGPIAWVHGVWEDSTPVMLGFVPTGIRYHTMSIEVLLVIKGGSLEDAMEQRDILLRAVIRAAMRPNNSFKPTPYGAA